MIKIFKGTSPRHSHQINKGDACTYQSAVRRNNEVIYQLMVLAGARAAGD